MTTPEPADCPTPAELLAFDRGDLPPEGIDRVGAHLEHCAACEASLDRLDPGADTAAESVRRAGPARVAAGAVLAGRYRLVELVGEGGMGSVWRAEQTSPVRRSVAVKLIKPGMDSRQVLARFDAERQALAVMDHPNIARVFDAGETDAGLPFFVMELVGGTPITRYCDERRLAPRERLGLFVQVCRAVQHAHQKGVIHRDLKPSNVLVAEVDGRPVPKVIDFGIAKATGAAAGDATLMTGLGSVVGTPEYMAPEQADPGSSDIDTRADVYALGVLLYELLTGSTPITRQRLKQAALLEILRLVREEEPARPSDRLSTADGLPSIAADRATEPRRLAGLVRGDLDWIVLKALEKNRTRRYDSAVGFAQDIERHLADEAVEARPPSARYRLGKLVRRNKGPAAAAALVVAALGAGVAGTGYGLVRAERARDAEAAERVRADEGRVEAEAARRGEAGQRALAEAKEAEATAALRFVEVNVLAAGRPAGQDGGLGRDVKLRDALAAAVPAVAGRFPGQPLVEARLRKTLGISFAQLGDHRAAEEQFRAVRDLYTAALGPHHIDTLRSMNNLANSFAALGRDAEALELRRETLALRQAHLPPGHPDTVASLNNLAGSYSDAGRLAEAVGLHEQAVAATTASLGPDHTHTLTARHNLAANYADLGRYAEALAQCEEVLARRRATLGPDHPDTLTSERYSADHLAALGRQAEALARRERVVVRSISVLGPDHPETLSAMHSLGNSYADLGRHREALEVRERSLARSVAVLGPDHPDTLTAMHNLADTFDDLGRAAEALALRETTLARMTAALGPDHPHTLSTQHDLAESLEGAGRLPEAARLHEANLARRRVVLGADHPHTLSNTAALARVYLALGRAGEARPLFDAAAAGWRRRLGSDPPSLADRLAKIGATLLDSREYAGAEPLLRECLEIRERSGPSGRLTANARSLLGAALSGLKRYAEAEPLLLAGYEGLAAPAAGAAPAEFADAADRLVALYASWRRPADAARWRIERAKYPAEAAPPPRSSPRREPAP